MCADNKNIEDIVSAAVTEERAKRIKILVEKNFSEDFIMQLFELAPDEYKHLYSRLYPFGYFTGPFKKFEEKEIKTRMLIKIGYTKEESEKIIEENPLFFPQEVDRKFEIMFGNDQ